MYIRCPKEKSSTSLTFNSLPTSIGSIAEGAQCESGWVPGPSNNCYLFVFNPKQNWENAQAKCVEKGADLVSIDSELERTWMHGYRSANYEEEQDIWIGGYQKNGDGR